MNLKENNQGISALPIVLIISSIILEVLVSGLVVGNLLSSSLLGEQASLEAIEIAKSGAHDAITRVIRYVDCPDIGDQYCPGTASSTIGNGIVCNYIGQSGSGHDLEITIYSKGVVKRRERYMKVLISADPFESKVQVVEMKEVENPNIETLNNCL
ncbi:MAG: hypothetical protein COT89_00565 [Candidatus Colwellbacteria bacterium CG10_big_fil_rev_8_21_14_0_10_42_22]|uniref:Type II secretion system protein n=1 Tax=Candidatus Colwellbacteria bacterium CG10_big_fil_rev_8_21_14_0_10_42_22 TaxID=1974540 RepID=A0A2H0VGF5_9BACT|nr:MAG: hypothetical protein COT89_00565 [Candidatus Colwellbacteria bacterium CG10_big_fil_rev_8_21_14_0_10_42_22]